MPRTATAASLDQVVRTALTPIISRTSTTIARAVAQMVAGQLESELAKTRERKSRVGRAPSRREMTRWTADRRARRVPTFVIEATGLDTKKAIVKKFGENATFEKGKPLPKAK